MTRRPAAATGLLLAAFLSCAGPGAAVADTGATESMGQAQVLDEAPAATPAPEQESRLAGGVVVLGTGGLLVFGIRRIGSRRRRAA